MHVNEKHEKTNLSGRGRLNALVGRTKARAAGLLGRMGLRVSVKEYSYLVWRTPLGETGTNGDSGTNGDLLGEWIILISGWMYF